MGRLVVKRVERQERSTSSPNATGSHRLAARLPGQDGRGMLPGRTARHRGSFREARLPHLSASSFFRTAAVSARIRRLLPVVLAATILTACSQDDPFRPIATTENVVSRLNVAALSGGIEAPSAVDFVNLRAVRPSLDATGGPNFQLAFDLAADGRVRLLPVLAMLNPPSGAGTVGLVRTGASFDDLGRAPTGGFVDDSTVTAALGEVWVVRINPGLCSFGDPFYAKLVVDEVDAVTRRLSIRFLINRNCGYRDLTVGLPRN